MTQNVRFEKSPSCPANEKLLAYQRRQLGPADEGYVRVHAENCEFCALALDLLRSHPEGEIVPPDPPPMPEHLRQLFSQRRDLK